MEAHLLLNHRGDVLHFVGARSARFTHGLCDLEAHLNEFPL